MGLSSARHTLSIRPGVLVLALITSIASIGGAQGSRIQVSAEVTVGGGPHTEQVGATWYHYKSSQFGSIAIGLTFPEIGRFRPLVMVDRSSTIAGDHVAICAIAPNGTCKRYFPGLAGYSASAGVRARVTNALDLDLLGGLGSLSGPSKHVAANLAFALTRDIRVVGGVRHIVIQHSSGNKLWWRPLTVGLRIQ